MSVKMILDAQTKRIYILLLEIKVSFFCVCLTCYWKYWVTFRQPILVQLLYPILVNDECAFSLMVLIVTYLRQIYLTIICK